MAQAVPRTGTMRRWNSGRKPDVQALEATTTKGVVMVPRGVEMDHSGA